jgi:hypothetical protein
MPDPASNLIPQPAPGGLAGGAIGAAGGGLGGIVVEGMKRAAPANGAPVA